MGRNPAPYYVKMLRNAAKSVREARRFLPFDLMQDEDLRQLMKSAEASVEACEEYMKAIRSDG
jgi:hypothetical protein